jgi:hypothetical protein
MENMGLMFRNFLEELINQGFKLPIYTIVVGSNGEIMAGKYDYSSEGALNHHELTQYSPEAGKVRLPMNIILIDSSGQAARCLMAASNEEPELKILN